MYRLATQTNIDMWHILSFDLLESSLCWRYLPVYLCEVLRVAAGGEGGGEGERGDHGQHQPQQPHARRVAGRRHVARQVHLAHVATRASNETTQRLKLNNHGEDPYKGLLLVD